MEEGIPAQRRRCATHGWCTVSGQGHVVHAGELHTVTNAEGTEIRIFLTAERDDDPVVRVEIAYGPTGPGLEVMDLDPTESVGLAGVLLRLARTAQAHHDADH